MVKITPELLRKRAEHNDGCLSTLEEIALHQFKIRKIEGLSYCKHLKILLLQNNRIETIENLYMLKELEYLNLAVNRVKHISGLNRCESLSKLDLTCNAISDVAEVSLLKDNTNLKELHLIGNPLTQYEYYREYVINALPQLQSLDMTEITNSERIEAALTLSKHKGDNTSMKPYDIDYEDSDDELLPDASQKLNDAARKTVDWERHRDIRQLRRGATVPGGLGPGSGDVEVDEDGDVLAPDGIPYQYNDGIQFWFEEDYKNQVLHLLVKTSRYLSRDSVTCEVFPLYCKVRVKTKGLLVKLPYEVKADKGSAHRVESTGLLRISMPIIDGLVIPKPIHVPRSSKQPSSNNPGEVGKDTVSDGLLKGSTCGVGEEESYSIPSDLPDLE